MKNLSGYLLVLFFMLFGAVRFPVSANNSEFNDSFNRADSTTVGNNWVEFRGDLHIVSNGLKSVSKYGYYWGAYNAYSLSSADQYASGYVTEVSNDFGFVLRMVDSTHQYVCRFRSGNTDVIFMRGDGGVDPTLLLDGDNGLSITAGHTYSCSVSGTGSSVILSAYKDGTQIATYTDTSSSRITANGNAGVYGYGLDVVYDSFEAGNLNPAPTPMPRIMVSPATTNVTVGTPFNVDVVVDGDSQAFNAAQATLSVSSNMSVLAVHNPSLNACNFQYTQSPTTSNPSFAGAVYGSSSTSCKVFTLTLSPTTEGVGYISLSNASIKAYSNNAEISSGVQDGSFAISGVAPTPSPTPALSLTINSYFPQTYWSSVTVGGTKDSIINQVFVNNSSTSVTYPTNVTWQSALPISSGVNTFYLYGRDSEGDQTATQTVVITKHTLGDINGDAVVNLIDASLFAVDWGKTSNLTYNLSDMDNNGTVDLSDLSILAKLITQ